MTISSLSPKNLKDFFPFFEKLMRENFPFYHLKAIDYFVKQNFLFKKKTFEKCLILE
jgi:hypothetical protein